MIIFKKNIYILLLLTFLAGILNLLFVLKFGRLSYELYVDDVGYALTALKSLINDNQIWLIDFINSHSPYQFFLASFGLKFFGYQDLSIYLSNLLPLFFLSYLIFYKFREENNFIFFILSFYILSSPIVYRLINEFRPDIFYGIILTFAVNCCLYDSIRELKSRILLSALITLSLFIKPTFILHTIFYIIFIILIVTIRSRLSIKNFISDVRDFFFFPLLISLIFFLKRYKGIIDHYINSFDTSGFMFDQKISFIELVYFNMFDSDYGLIFIGVNLYVFIFLFLISLPLIKNKLIRSEVLKMYVIPSVAIISFLILCQTRQINQHVYSTFHFSIIFSSCIFISYFFNNFNLLKIKKIIFIYLMLIISVLNIQFYKFNTFGILSNLERVEIGKSDNKDLILMINNNLNSIENNVVVYVPFYTPVNFLSLNWYQTLLDYKNSNNSNINYLFESPNVNIDLLIKKLNQIDILIIPKIESKYLFKFFKINELLPETYDELENNKKLNFKKIENENFYLYLKNEL